MSVSYVCQKTAAQVDDLLMGKFGYLLPQLVEQAGLAAAVAAARVFPRSNRAIILAGPGNNGADGLVAARHLKLFGYECSVVYPRRSSNPIMQSLQQQCEVFSIDILPDLPRPLPSSNTFFVDAFFGFSFKPPVRSPFDSILKEVVDSKLPVISVDIPSGWDVETGPPTDGTTVLQPEALISLSVPKSGVKSFSGRHFLGGRFLPPGLLPVLSISIPPYPGEEMIQELPRNDSSL
ncbi:hypothetical protein PRIPAC_84758 [Pristionchus pacificus]|uniref:NAD(P)H-hydrate epimerase n=1 Tax=Pristionchus pacificus TaxID=54126 RepID=A0A2A6BN09_PRIPA|nr:hypothetical protein PRIPAC_84758 [Pristionchus pacificus]|eukprot:PDM67289.1 hypothetical protein PRIPAC_48706 [Pristionchus pacificus]